MIKRKISQGAYTTLESFEDDFDLMFENAKQYNAEGSDVYLDAEDLQVRETSLIGYSSYNLCFSHPSLNVCTGTFLERDWQGCTGTPKEQEREEACQGNATNCTAGRYLQRW